MTFEELVLQYEEQFGRKLNNPEMEVLQQAWKKVMEKEKENDISNN